MLITFEPNVAQMPVAYHNDHKSKACLPEASNTAFTMYRRLRRLYEAPFFWRLTALFSTFAFGNVSIYSESYPSQKGIQFLVLSR